MPARGLQARNIRAERIRTSLHSHGWPTLRRAGRVRPVKDGKPVATITWSSDKYDQMVVDDETFLPTIADGHSIFDIDVIGFDYKMPVKAETTAMSEPYMIDYTLYFDSSTIEKCE